MKTALFFFQCRNGESIGCVCVCVLCFHEDIWGQNKKGLQKTSVFYECWLILTFKVYFKSVSFSIHLSKLIFLSVSVFIKAREQTQADIWLLFKVTSSFQARNADFASKGHIQNTFLAKSGGLFLTNSPLFSFWPLEVSHCSVWKVAGKWKWSTSGL